MSLEMNRWERDLQDFLKRTNLEKLFNVITQKFVAENTFIDKENYINFCDDKSCLRSALRVDYYFLKEELKFRWNLVQLYVGTSNYNKVLDFIEYAYDISGWEAQQWFWSAFLMKEIYDVYYKPMEDQPSQISEGENKTSKYKLSKSDIAQLMNHYEYMGYDEEWAKEDLIALVNYLNGLKSPLKIYRIICADSKEDINLTQIGSHYSSSKVDLIRDHYDKGSIAGHCVGDKIFLLTVSADKSMVDVMETLSNNILYPHEKEITLKNEGYGANIITIEEL